MNIFKVAYIITPITFGGAEKISLNFLSSVDRNCFEIRPILLTRPWEEEPYFAREIHRLGYAYEKVPVAIRTKGLDPLRLTRVAYHFHSLLKKGAFDLVHTQGYFADICGLPIAKWLEIPTISTCHGYISNDRKLRIYNRVDTYALRLCNTIIAVSNGIKAELIRKGINGSRISVIPNAVTSSFGKDELLIRRHEKRMSLGINSKDFVVGFLGRLSEEKGLNYLIEAIEELRHRQELVKLIIVGDGSERSVLEKIVKEKGLETSTFFAGFQKSTDKWLPAFDVFVLPSLTEGTPMALLEAMAMGVPVIATAIGGVPEVITDGMNGMLVPPGNPKAISEKIRMLKADSELKDRLAVAGADIINNKYSIYTWCEAVENQYSTVINQANPPNR